MNSPFFENSVDLLRAALEDLEEPWKLNSHPWANSALTQGKPGNEPGEQLAFALEEIFLQTMPSQPPRKGKRLDTKWGQFGILAAQHFAPRTFHLHHPETQRNAWLAIDQAIALYAARMRNLPAASFELEKYQLIRHEVEVAPSSTISGWYSKALENLLVEIGKAEKQAREKQESRIATHQRKQRIWNWAGALSVFLFVIALGWMGWQGYDLYRKTLAIYDQVQTLQNRVISENLDANTLLQISPQVTQLRHDLGALEQDAIPYLRFAPFLYWIPNYGGEISQAGPLLKLASNLTVAADEIILAATPVLKSAAQNSVSQDLPQLIKQLKENRERLIIAQLALAQAQTARQEIQSEKLSLETRTLLETRLDPVLQEISDKVDIEEMLFLLDVAPSLLGSDETGEKNYLLLFENEDELRPTGGFITAVGRLTVRDGKLIHLETQSVELAEDTNKPYPKPPWQLEEIMNLRMWVLRDANWYTDFPSTVEMVKYFYSYTYPGPVDGVIAIDQHAVVEILRNLGPVNVPGVAYPINSENVLEYMRAAKSNPPPGTTTLWDRKHFIKDLAQPILQKAFHSSSAQLPDLLQILFQLLEQRHVLLYVEEPHIKEYLAKKKWDGAVRLPDNSDYLLIADANVSYNKSNAVMQTSLEYRVDLTRINAPQAWLTLYHTNHAVGDLPCLLMAHDMEEKEYPINECHWTYVRVYKPAGATLLSATPHEIPASQTMLDVPIPARIDDLGDEDIPAAQVYGTIVLIPQQTTQKTDFHFNLSASSLQFNSPQKSWIYRLYIQKQAGIVGLPVTIMIQLPPNSLIISASPLPNGSPTEKLQYKLTLKNDWSVEIQFQVDE